MLKKQEICKNSSEKESDVISTKHTSEKHIYEELKKEDLVEDANRSDTAIVTRVATLVRVLVEYLKRNQDYHGTMNSKKIDTRVKTQLNAGLKNMGSCVMVNLWSTNL